MYTNKLDREFSILRKLKRNEIPDIPGIFPVSSTGSETGHTFLFRNTKRLLSLSKLQAVTSTGSVTGATFIFSNTKRLLSLSKQPCSINLKGEVSLPRGFMYILECSDGSYYTGSTVDLERRIYEHQNKIGANYTKKRSPVKLIYYEEYPRIDEAFYREKQIQGWSRNKKQALIKARSKDLPLLSKNYTQFKKPR